MPWGKNHEEKVSALTPKQKKNLISNQQISLQGIAFGLTQQYSRRFGCTVEFRQIPSDGSGIFFIHQT